MASADGGPSRVNHGTLFPLMICGVLLLCVHVVAASSRPMVVDKLESTTDAEKKNTVENVERLDAVVLAATRGVDDGNNTKKEDGDSGGHIISPAAAAAAPAGSNSGVGNSSQQGDEDEHHGVGDGAGGLFKHAHDHLHKWGKLVHKKGHKYHFHDHDDQLPDPAAAAGPAAC